MSEVFVQRSKLLLNSVIFVDGQPGCGKTLFSAIIAAMDRVELMNYTPELENLCALGYLKKISEDALKAMIRIQMDLFIYETMMSRRVNLRPSDMSSVFRDVEWFTYLKRLLQKGDEVVPERIIKENPILHFATHNLLAYSEPIFSSLDNKAYFIEVVRHPLYMVIQQTMNQEGWYTESGRERQFQTYIKYCETEVPFWNINKEERYLKGNPVERAIYEMEIISENTKYAKINKLTEFKERICTIPFEKFVLNPKEYLNKIKKLLNTKVTSKTKRILKKQNVPRKKISDGIPLAIYKRCGWEEPVDGFTEKDELNKRREFVVNQGASKEALDVLDNLCFQYESNYYDFSEGK